MQTTSGLLSHARLVLGGFVLALLVAAAAPLLQLPALGWACGAQGPVLVPEVVSDAGAPLGEHGLECALCLQVNTPPGAGVALSVPLALARATWVWPSIEAGHRHQARAPLPARGPPLLS